MRTTVLQPGQKTDGSRDAWEGQQWRYAEETQETIQTLQQENTGSGGYGANLATKRYIQPFPLAAPARRAKLGAALPGCGTSSVPGRSRGAEARPTAPDDKGRVLGGGVPEPWPQQEDN